MQFGEFLKNGPWAARGTQQSSTDPAYPLAVAKAIALGTTTLANIFGAWSHIQLGLVQIDIWAGQTDRQTCAKYN